MRNKLIIGVLAMTVFIACSKLKESPEVFYPDPEPSIVPNTKFSTPDELLSSWIAPPTTITKDASGDINIITPGGIEIFFPALSLKMPDGSDATGNVEFEIQEYNTKASMILSGVTTLTNDGRLLESGGMLNITASQNGQPLSLKIDSIPDSNSVSFQFPNPKNLDSMEAFSGNELPNEENKVSWERRTDWNAIKNLGNNVFKIMQINRLGYINLDRYMKKKYANCNLRVRLLDSCLAGSTQGNATPVKAIFLFPDNRSVAVIPFLKRDGYTLEFATQPRFGGPAGDRIIVLLIGICDGVLKYHKATVDVKDEDNLLEINSMETISEEDLKTLLSSYDN